MFLMAAATPKIKKIYVSQGLVSNSPSKYTPMKYPMKIDSATCNPRLAKYERSFICRQFRFFNIHTLRHVDLLRNLLFMQSVPQILQHKRGRLTQWPGQVN